MDTFADASEKAYAAVVYLRNKIDEKYQVDLIFSKNRLCPTKGITILRPKLLALLIGIRATAFGRELRLSFKRRIVGCDSKCVIHWLKTTKVLSTFVSNRIKEIKDAKGVEIYYVQSNENTADIATRGCTSLELVNKRNWWAAPNWLSMSENQWPQNLED